MITQNAIQSNKKQQKNESAFLESAREIKSHLSDPKKKGAIQTLDVLIGLSNHYENIYPSVKTIADKADRSPRQTIRNLQQLSELGLVSIEHRKKDAFQHTNHPFAHLSNRYVLHPMFKNLEVRNILCDLLPSLKYLPLVLLIISSSTFCKSIFQNTNNGPESSYDSINLDYNIYKNKKAYRACARKEFANCTTFTKKRGGENMEFSQTVRRVGDELSLSNAGMCSISAFHEVVLNKALRRITTYSQTINDPFKLFISLCRQISNEMKIQINSRKAYDMARYFSAQLGKDSPVLEGKNSPRIPQKVEYGQKISQRKVSVNAPPKVFVETVESLRLKNPDIAIVGFQVISPGVVSVQHHHDVQWRETTQEEREIWIKNVQELRKISCNPFLKFMPINPPVYFQGNPNTQAFDIYHIDNNGILHKNDHERVL